MTIIQLMLQLRKIHIPWHVKNLGLEYCIFWITTKYCCPDCHTLAYV